MWTNIRWGVLYRNDATHCMLYVERHTEPVWHFYDHALAPLVPRPSPWRSKRPSSSTPTCWWQKQWLSGKQSLPLRSCSRKHRYVTLVMVKMWSELHEDSTPLHWTDILGTKGKHGSLGQMCCLKGLLISCLDCQLSDYVETQIIYGRL